ncbi:MAG: type I-F CRISPR-associated helicase Cas3, partial [Methylomarinum sp.]|nr:type I-F CRISPR-associated helicase Cas3 [Methylomarinum sp.]
LQTEQQQSTQEKQGSESAESLLKDELQLHHQLPDYDGKFAEWFEHDEKILKLIQAPVLVSTIDYLMPATEGLRGGRQIAPMLRLLTSDLVLDEPDDFGLEDLPALCRLVNWAGVLGSRVLLSTATISPELVSALFDAYQQGRMHYTQVNGENDNATAICCAWFDEYKKPINHTISSLDDFKTLHKEFVDKRVANLNKGETGLRQAKIITVDAEEQLKPTEVFANIIHSSINQLHKQHSIEHSSGKKVSIGLVRMANINPLVAVSKLLYAKSIDKDTHIYFCVYHSQYPLVLRSYIEGHLDKALTRHNDSKWWKDSGIETIITNSNVKNHIFVVLATSVAEVGRDHDYDWAIVEPSSMRSIIQLAGRIQRHRKQAPASENIHILDKNFKALKGESPAYLRPGFESEKRQFNTHQVSDLLNEDEYKNISAIPRIKKLETIAVTKTNPPRFERFNELEHIVQEIRLFGNLNESNFAKLWWEHDTTWCGEIQSLQPFRQSYAMEDYNLSLNHFENLRWQKKKQGVYPVKYEQTNDIKPVSSTEFKIAKGKFTWFEISISSSIKRLQEELKPTVTEDVAYKKFTHIQLRKNDKEDISRWKYHECLGVFKELIKDDYIDEK